MNNLKSLLFVSLLMPSVSYAKDIACYIDTNCSSTARSSSSSPSTGNQIRINPALVPTQNGLGVEGIYYDSAVDFAIVRGLGRIGAAISPSNSDETYFGTPGFEIAENLLDRKTDKKKFPNQKITLATAMTLVEKNRSALTSYALRLGVMGKYNQLTKHAHMGAGLSGMLGPLVFGVSSYNDESRVDYSILGSDYTEDKKYRVKTASVGLSFPYVLLDVSQLRYQDPQYSFTTDETEVNIATISVNYKKFIVTLSQRREKSYRPVYDYETKTLKYEYQKYDTFQAVQYIASKNVTIGLLHNYYMLREVAFIGTIFF